MKEGTKKREDYIEFMQENKKWVRKILRLMSLDAEGHSLSCLTGCALLYQNGNLCCECSENYGLLDADSLSFWAGDGMACCPLECASVIVMIHDLANHLVSSHGSSYSLSDISSKGISLASWQNEL